MHPIRGKMPLKNTKKTTEDRDPPELEIVETVSSFERQILKKMDKIHGTLKALSEHVSKLSNFVSTAQENTAAKEVVSAAGESSNEILKEMAHTLKDILKAKETVTRSQPIEIQETTQIFVQQEAEKVKQTMIQTWNTKLRKRAAEIWQTVRNENTAKTYEIWKNNSPIIIPRKFQMQKINEELIAQTQLREKQVMFTLQSEIELMKLRSESHEERYKNIDKDAHASSVRPAVTFFSPSSNIQNQLLWDQWTPKLGYFCSICD